MHIDDCYYLGYFSKTIGTKGELALTLKVDSPSDYLDIESFLIQIQKQDQQLVPFFLEASALQNNGLLRCKLETIDTLGEAKNMVGMSVFLPLSLLKPLGENQFYFHEIINYAVIDDRYGKIGKVQEVLEYNNSNLLSISFKGKEILVPISDSIIKKVDKENCILYVDSPEGLIELYLEN